MLTAYCRRRTREWMRDTQAALLLPVLDEIPAGVRGKQDACPLATAFGPGTWVTTWTVRIRGVRRRLPWFAIFFVGNVDLRRHPDLIAKPKRRQRAAACV